MVRWIIYDICELSSNEEFHEANNLILRRVYINVVTAGWREISMELGVFSKKRLPGFRACKLI